MKNLLNKNLIIFVVILGVGIYAGISVVRFKPQIFNLNKIPSDQIEATILSDKVGLLMSLPSDELPSIETVTDLALLKDKPFFATAQVGDKVLIYEKASLAVLYRPSKNIIIKTVSPNYTDALISSASPSPVAVATAVPTPIPVVTPVPAPVATAEPVSTISATLITPTPTPKPVAK